MDGDQVKDSDYRFSLGACARHGRPEVPGDGFTIALDSPQGVLGTPASSAPNNVKE